MSAAFKKASSFTVKFLPSFGKKKQVDSEISVESVEEDVPGAEESTILAPTVFSRTQSFPVTRSEQASLPSTHEIHSVKSILRQSRFPLNADEEAGKANPLAEIIPSFAKVLDATNSDSEEEDVKFGRVSSSERKNGNYSPKPVSRAKTAPALLLTLTLGETKPPVSTPNPGLSISKLSKLPVEEKKLDRYLKDSAQSAGIQTKPAVVRHV